MKFTVIPYAFILCKRPRCQALSNALQKSKIQNSLLPYSPMKLKYYYKFLITDALLNTWKKTGLIFIYQSILLEIVIHMFAYSSLHYFPYTAYK